MTERADSLFPKAYGELTNELLGYVSESDSELVDQLFAASSRRARAQRAGAARAVAQPEGQGRGADAHPRRGRLPRDVRGDARVATGSSSTTARSWPSPRSTGRRARARSTSSGRCCRGRSCAGQPHHRWRPPLRLRGSTASESRSALGLQGTPFAQTSEQRALRTRRGGTPCGRSLAPDRAQHRGCERRGGGRGSRMTEEGEGLRL